MNPNTQIQDRNGKPPNDREPLIKTSHPPSSYKAIKHEESTISTRHDILESIPEVPIILYSSDGSTTRVQSPEPAVPNYSVTRARVASTLVLVLYAMGPACITSIIAQYLDHRWTEEAQLNQTNTANQSSCSKHEKSAHDDIQARVSIQTMYYSYTLSIPATFSCLLLGAYCDVFGRRMIFLMPIVGALAKLSICFAIMRYNLDVNFFYLAQGLDGISGSVFAILVASYTMSADISIGKSSRIIWSVILAVFADVIISSSSIASGYLVDFFGFPIATVFLICPVILAFLLTVTLLPETKPEVKRRNANLWKQIVRMVRIYTSEGDFRHRMALLMSLVLFFFVAFTLLNISSVDTLYQMRNPFCWNATLIGYYSAARYAGQAIIGGIYLKIMQLMGCISDEKIAMIGCLFRAASAVLEAFVKDTWTFFMVPVLGFPGFVSIGIIRGIMSLLVGPHNQGAMFATVAFVENICNILSATVFNQVYAATVSTWPGAVFILMAAIALFTFFLFFVFFYFYNEPTKPYDLIVPAKEEISPEDIGNQT